MRGIPEEIIKEMAGNEGSGGLIYTSRLLKECRELNPWMTLDEFLKSGTDGWCWINSNQITIAYKIKGDFYLNNAEADSRVYKIDQITHVIPLHKPEQPK